MKRAILLGFVGLCVCFYISPIGNQNPISAFAADPPKNGSPLSLEDVMAGVEKRYSATGFSASFKQNSTIKAMDITDSASGNLTVKRPGKMRWEYEQPESQTIITDGKTLWVYKPEDHQVMMGSYPAFFGDGKGASFLSDMKLIREKFNIALESVTDNGNPILKLIPQKKEVDISKVYLLISHKTFDILQITTYNTDEDETQIMLSDTRFHHQIDDRLFQFDIQDNIDVLQLDE